MVRFVDQGVVWHARIASPEDGRPVRKLITGRRKRVTGFFPSRKAGHPGLVPWESELERDYLILAEFRPSAIAIAAQPHTVEIWSDDESFDHTPDFLLSPASVAEKPEIVEVKPGAIASRRDIEDRLRISSAAHQALGYMLSVVGEAEIRKQPRLANAGFLLRYRLAKVRGGLEHRIATLLAGAAGQATIRQCVQATDGRASTRFEVYALACRGLVQLDLSDPLGPDTVVSCCRLPATGDVR